MQVRLISACFLGLFASLALSLVALGVERPRLVPVEIQTKDEGHLPESVPPMLRPFEVPIPDVSPGRLIAWFRTPEGMAALVLGAGLVAFAASLYGWPRIALGRRKGSPPMVPDPVQPRTPRPRLPSWKENALRGRPDLQMPQNRPPRYGLGKRPSLPPWKERLLREQGSTEPYGLAQQPAPVPVGPTEARLPNKEEIAFLQQLFGITGETDGLGAPVYGPKTKAVVAAVQLQYQIPVDAQFTIGPKTWTVVQRIHRGEVSFQGFSPTCRVLGNRQVCTPLPSQWMVVGAGDGVGWRQHPIEDRLYEHKGVDHAAPRGVPVYAVMEGKVIHVEDGCKHEGPDYHNCGGTYGNQVVIEHADGTVTRYAHLTFGTVMVKKGETVSPGKPLGLVGSTGKSTGLHLHWEHRQHAKPSADYFDPLELIPDLFNTVSTGG